MDNNYCRNLITGLTFHQDDIRFCTTLEPGPVISVYNEKQKEIASKIIDKRKEMAELIHKNELPKECNSCIYKNSQGVDSEKINKIDLFYWYHCNCSCIYCSFRNITKGNYSDRQIEGNPLIYKVLEELYKQEEIGNNLTVVFGGGEIGVLKEFPKLINLFLKHNVLFVHCESSGIRYSKDIEKLLKMGKGGITVAVCAGTKETYSKIKRRDKYNQVMKNLQNYVNAAKKYKNDISNVGNVTSKYIIINGINDNLIEVEKWLQESKKYGLIKVEISMEFCWGIHTKKGQKVEDYNYKIFEYCEKRCKELNLTLSKNLTSLAIMEKGVY